MKRDILNHLGQKVGELELPDGTSEEEWTEKLSQYARVPAQDEPQSEAILKVQKRRRFGALLIDSFVAGNLGGSVEARRALASRTEEVQRLLLAGSLEPALAAMDEVTVDELLPLEMLNNFKAKVQAFLDLE